MCRVNCVTELAVLLVFFFFLFKFLSCVQQLHYTESRCDFIYLFSLLRFCLFPDSFLLSGISVVLLI